MKIISHRGNLNGRDPQKENTVDYINKALELFDVEIDVRVLGGQIYLGHDEPQEEIDLDFLLQNNSKLWVHCKNIDALEFLKDKNVNCFGHSLDAFVLTSKNYIFTFPNTQTSESSAIVDLKGENKYETDVFGVCTDYPIKLKTRNI